MTYQVPLHVRMLTKCFYRCYPVYRWIYFIYKRHSDKQLCDFLREELRARAQNPACLVLDIGANVGFFSRFLAEHAGSHATVLAFEPAPDNVKRLREEVQNLPQVIVHPCAVADSKGILKLTLSPDSVIDHHISRDQTAPPAANTRTVLVPTVTVDDICQERGSVDIIKMDIQGAECMALRGMRHTLARSPHCVMVMELWPWGFTRGGDTWESFFTLLEDYGLDAKTFDNSDVRGFCIAHADNPRAYTNIYVRARSAST